MERATLSIWLAAGSSSAAENDPLDQAFEKSPQLITNKVPAKLIAVNY